MRVASRRGIGVFRLTSGSTNKAAHRQIARIKFKEAARFSVYEPGKGMRLTPGPGASRVRPSEFREVMQALRRTKEFALGTGVAWHEFTAAALTPTLVERRIREGGLWRVGEAVAILQEGGEGGPRWEEVGFIGGPVENAMTLVTSLVGRDKRAKERWVFMPQGSPLIHVLRSRGFVRNFSMILFERSAAKR